MPSAEKPKGAMASEHLRWVESKYQRPNDFEQRLIYELLFRSPAVGCSAQSDGYIARFGLKTTEAVILLRDELLAGVETKWCRGAADLKSRLEADYRLDHLDLEASDYAYMLVSSKTDLIDREIVGLIETRKTARSKQKAEMVRQRFLEVDGIFRHLRNALAHGAFQRFANARGEPLYVFQDADSKGQVSARLKLSEQKLRSIVSLINEADKMGY